MLPNQKQFSYLILCLFHIFGLAKQETCQFKNEAGNRELDFQAVNITFTSRVQPNNSEIYFFNPCGNSNAVPPPFPNINDNPCLQDSGYSVIESIFIFIVS